MFDFDDRDLFGDSSNTASPASQHSADALLPAGLTVVLADDAADPDDFIFEGINITQTAARSWVPEELPDFGVDLPDLWTPGSSAQPESPIATPKDDEPLPGLSTKATGSPHPENDCIDPRGLCTTTSAVQVGTPVETRSGTPEQLHVSLQHAANVSSAGGPATATSLLGECDPLDFFLEAAPLAPKDPAHPIPCTEDLNEMMAAILGPVVEMPHATPPIPQAARPMAQNVPMMPPMPSMPPMMQYAAPTYATSMYPPAYGYPASFVTPQELFWMAQASMLSQQQQQLTESGPIRRKQARARPSPYQHAQQVSHAGLYDGWRQPQQSTKRSDYGEPPQAGSHRGRRCPPKNPLRLGNMADWPPGMPLPGVAPPAGQA